MSDRLENQRYLALSVTVNLQATDDRLSATTSTSLLAMHNEQINADQIKMSIRQQFLSLIEQLSDEQLAVLLPLAESVRDRQVEVFSNESSQAYQDWVGAENDIYDDLFTDELATR